MTHLHPSQDFPAAPEPGLPAHSRVLRRALLARHGEKAVRPRLSFFLLQPMKRFVPFAALSIAVLIVAVTSVIPQTSLTPTPVANAQELLNRAVTKASVMPTDMRAEIEKRMKSDMAETLKEAKAAPDLRILTPDEFEQEMHTQMQADQANSMPIEGSAQGFGIAVSGESGVLSTSPTEVHLIKMDEDQIPQVSSTATFEAAVAGTKFTIAPVEIKEPVKYLAYTNPAGQSVILGLDEDDVPVMKIMRLMVRLNGMQPATIMTGTINAFEVKDLKTE